MFYLSYCSYHCGGANNAYYYVTFIPRVRELHRQAVNADVSSDVRALRISILHIDGTKVTLDEGKH